jgi:hypothetical protein
MPKNDTLPTLRSAQWSVTSFRDSLIETLNSDHDGERILLFLYAVTLLGWDEVEAAAIGWKERKKGREIVAFVGTDHGLTEPEAVKRMVEMGVEVWLPTDYTGTFHPKAVWLTSRKSSIFWIGSNNLTQDGLLNNIECACVIHATSVPADLTAWRERVEESSEQLTPALLESYREERIKFNKQRAKIEQKRRTPSTFVWSRRTRRRPRRGATADAHGAAAPTALPGSDLQAGDLIMEIMPLETGSEGKQVQFPKPAAVRFFGLRNRVGASKQITLSYVGGKNPRSLTATIFPNRTIRLSLAELDYRHRPCLIRVRRTGADAFEYEIIQKSIFPQRYEALLALCSEKTRKKSRRWGMVTA